MRAQSAEGSAPARRAAAAVLFANGEGGRGSAEPPALTRAAGTSLLEVCTKTVERCDEIEGFVAVVPDGMEDRVAGVVRESSKFLAAVPRGRSRRESVTAGLTAVPPRFDVVVC